MDFPLPYFIISEAIPKPFLLSEYLNSKGDGV